MPGQSFQRIITQSELLNANLKPQLTDMPHLKQDSDDLDGIITSAKSLAQEQQTLRGRLREITRLRKEAETSTNTLRSRVVAQLQGKLGFTNENLLSYGVAPRKRNRKKAAKPEPQPPAVTPPPPAHGTTAPSAAPAEPAKP
jgi:hypothetical protein